MKRFPIQALAFLAVLGAGHCADKPMEPENLEAVISGRVVDVESGQPVAGAVVSTDPPTEQVLCQFAADRLPAFSAKGYHRFSPKVYHFLSVSADPA